MLLPVAATPALLRASTDRLPARRTGPLWLAGCGFLPVALVGGVWGGAAGPVALEPIALACLIGLSVAAFAAGYAATGRQR